MSVYVRNPLASYGGPEEKISLKLQEAMNDDINHDENRRICKFSDQMKITHFWEDWQLEGTILKCLSRGSFDSE